MLQTTATYIPETDEFEVNSPTMTAHKWWIGGGGAGATHAVVQARLLLRGKDLGPHLFFVQLRSLDDHTLMPNVSTGDIGPKVYGGYSYNDNGFIRFDRVRIPRFNMLAKNSKVTDKGEYIKPPNAKLSYGGESYRVLADTLRSSADLPSRRTSSLRGSHPHTARNPQACSTFAPG